MKNGEKKNQDKQEVVNLVKEELLGVMNQLEYIEGIIKYQKLEDTSVLELLEKVKEFKNNL